MKRDTRIEIPVYKLIHARNYTCLKPYALQIIRVANHTRYKSYTLQIIRVWNDGIWLDDQQHNPALQIIRVCNHTRYKSYALQIIRVWNEGIWLGDEPATHPCPVLLSPRVASRRGRSSVAKRVFYNMVCSALFLQRALCTVHCTI